MVLKSAAAAFDRGQLEVGAAHLDAFIHKVQSRVMPIDAALARALIERAQALIDAAAGGGEL